MRWVHSKAMLADGLTKVMDSSSLREAMTGGIYALFDEDLNLLNRVGQRQSLKWLKQGSTAVPNGPMEAECRSESFDECQTCRVPATSVAQHASCSSPTVGGRGRA